MENANGNGQTEKKRTTEEWSRVEKSEKKAELNVNNLQRNSRMVRPARRNLFMLLLLLSSSRIAFNKITTNSNMTISTIRKHIVVGVQVVCSFYFHSTSFPPVMIGRCVYDLFCIVFILHTTGDCDHKINGNKIVGIENCKQIQRRIAKELWNEMPKWHRICGARELTNEMNTQAVVYQLRQLSLFPWCILIFKHDDYGWWEYVCACDWITLIRRIVVHKKFNDECNVLQNYMGEKLHSK